MKTDDSKEVIVEKNEKIKDIVKGNPIQKIFMVLAIFTAIWLIPFSYACY